MKLAIMQPTFNPWIGYFDLIDCVDTFVFFDNVQLARRSWQVRNKFKINNKEYMFTLPVEKSKSRDELLIKDAKISYNQFDFREKLSVLIKQNYKKALFYQELIEPLMDVINFKTDFLSLYNTHFIISISQLLGYKTKFIYASDIKDLDGSKGELIFNIANRLKCSEYVSALGSKEYLEYSRNLFDKACITISYQYYKHPVYNQIGSEFLPYLGVLDLLLNEGVDNSRDIILKGRCFES